MNRYLLLSLICLMATTMVSAQQQLPVNKKVSFGQDGKMFVNKELGIYLWLSTSPDENAVKHRLKSDSTKQYTNPMYFDTEGYNSLRSPSAVDTATKKTIYPVRDIVFEVYADGEPPVSDFRFLTGPTRYLQGKRYYGGKVKAILKSKDAVSGVEKSYYSVESAPYSEYKDSLSFTNDGEVTIKFYSTDMVGNREAVKEKKFIVDNTAPVTKYEIEGKSNEKYLSPDTKIKLVSNDNLIGVKTIYYKINNGSTKVYSNPIPVQWLGSSNGTVTFWATDYLNNKEDKQVIGGKDNSGATTGGNGHSFEFYVDKDAPSVEIDFEGQHINGKYTYVSKKTKLKVNADDDKSGVDKINYSVNNKNVDQTYSDYIEFSEDGIAYIRINATDFVGNTSATVVKTIYVDNEAPITKSVVYSPKHKVKDTLFVTKNTKISLSSNDKASGVSEVYFTYSNREKELYTKAFTLEGDGIINISYWGLDNVGNKENENNLEVFVDNNPPEIYHHFSSNSIGSKNIRNEEYTIFPADVKLYVAATDKESGGEKVTYKINGGPVKTINPILGLTPSNYEVEIIAYDVLGNSTMTTIRFAVEQ